MDFKGYIKRYGSTDAKWWAKHPAFPKEANWRKLKLFINKHYVPEDITAELEQLHDDFYCRCDELRLLGRW